MKHIIFGGNGFVGRYTARDLLAAGEQVLICDIAKDDLPIYDKAAYLNVDITKPDQVAKVPIAPDDIVYNLAARMLHPIIKRRERYEYFYSVDYHGAVNIVESMERAGCDRLIQFSTDMVYGPLQTAPPVKVDHPRVPIGEYSASKMACESIGHAYRKLLDRQPVDALSEAVVAANATIHDRGQIVAHLSRFIEFGFGHRENFRPVSQARIILP